MVRINASIVVLSVHQLQTGRMERVEPHSTEKRSPRHHDQNFPRAQYCVYELYKHNS